jgi:hypothetical protein
LLVRDLRHVYRGPSLFAAKLREEGIQASILSCDEHLEVSDFDGSNLRLAEELDLLYIATHGTFDSAGYHALFHRNDWTPGASGIGLSRLSVAVFDTCFLIDSAQPWSSVWSNANLGNNLRLLLGFDSLAAMDRGSLLRGRAFAELISGGEPFASAWIKAVHQTRTSRYDKAVAVAIGNDFQDAQNIMDHMSIDHMPQPRSGGSPTLLMRS